MQNLIPLTSCLLAGLMLHDLNVFSSLIDDLLDLADSLLARLEEKLKGGWDDLPRINH